MFIVVPLAVFGMVALLGVFAAGMFFVLQRNGAFAPPRPRPPAESVAEKQAANAEAFGKEAVSSDASPEEIDSLLLLLERATRVKTAEQVEACFDIERLYREAEAAATNREIFRAPGALEGFREGVTGGFAKQALLANYVSAEIKRVKFLGSRDEAIVFSQHRTAEGLGAKMRWWVTRSRGKWKIYDFEDLDRGIRSSASVAAVIDTGGKQGLAPRQSEVVSAVTAANALLVQKQFDQVEELVRPTLDVPLPKAIAAWRLAQLAIVQTSRSNWEEVIDLVDRAAEDNPEMPALSMLRAQALNGLGRFEEAATEARKYIAELGGDDHGSFLLGTALAGMGRNDEAADAFRQGLDAYSSSVDNLVGLAGVLPDEAVAEIADRFAVFRRPTASFVDVASQLTTNDNVAALAAVVEKNCELAPRDPHNDYYQGELHWHRAEYDQAAEAFGRALAKLPEDERLSCQKAKRNSLLYAKKPVEAYHAMPDGDDTFLAICNYLVQNRDADGLDQMTALHAKRKPDDSWLPYFRGEALMLREHYDEAATIFRPMLHAELPEGMRSSYQDEYLAAEIKAGRPLEAYQAVPDATDAFLDAANRLLHDRNTGDLERLVALHAERKPDDPYATYFRGEVFYLRGQTAEAVTVWEPLLASELPAG
ncbi:MAG: tetratricopeptide repeat protein, partial [Pirellulales bacterium]